MSSDAKAMTEGPDLSSRSAPWLGLAGFLAASFVVAAIGGFATAPEIPTWYAVLEKPAFNPPSWIFAPVWTVLYIVMAVAAWLIWKTPTTARRLDALMLYAIQLILNLLWTPLFFHFHRIGFALVDIVLLDLAVLLATIIFWKVRVLSGALMVPYLAWTCFATALNAAIFKLN